MKLKIHLLLAGFLLISDGAFSTPLSGTYTIGGSSPNYASFTAAVSDLNTRGVSGAVNFNVRTGIYNEQVMINAAIGASTTNTVTFQSESGAASDVTITYTASGTSDDYVIYLNGASNMIFKNLTVTAVGATYAKAFVLKNGSTNDSFMGNALNCGISGWDVVTSMVIDASPTNGLNNDSITLIDNQINGGSFGYETEGTGNGENNGLVIKNNIFSNSYYAEVNIGYCNNAIIQGNTFLHYSGGYAVVVLNYCDQVRILNNNINDGYVGYGLYIPSAGVAGREGLIADNFISAQVALYGNGTTNQLFYNNTLYSTEYVVILQSGSDNVFENNIIYNTITGSYGIFADNTISVSDYNDFYIVGAGAAGPPYFGQWNGMNCDNFATWQSVSGMDAHSRTVLPPFISDTNFRLTNCDSLRFGMPMSLVPYDIDSNLRSSVTTVVGAYECPLAGAAQFTASTTSICPGTSINFTDQSTGSPTNWEWTFNGGTPDSSSSQNPTVTYDSSGTFDVKLVVTTGSGADSVIKAEYITVNSLPRLGTISATPDSVCTGDSSKLVVTGSTGSIQWQSGLTGNPFTNADNADSSIYITPPLSETTNYRLVAVNENCSDTSVAIQVVVNPVPIPPDLSTLDSSICTSDSVLITPSGSYSSYLWNNGDTRSFTYATGAGGYWVTVTDANGCSAVSGHQDISVFPVPSVSIDVQGDTLTSFNSSTYQWFFSDTAIQGANAYLYVARQTGNYAVQVTDTNGCKALSNNVYVTITGITEVDGNSLLNIYPDPFTNTIFIGLSGGTMGIGNIEVYNMLGEVILSKKTANLTSGPTSMDVSALPPGVYCLGITMGNTMYTKKMIKE